MTVSDLIAALKKYDGDLPVFIDGVMELGCLEKVQKIKFNKEEIEDIMMTNIGRVIRYKRDRYDKKAMNTKFEKAILIS